MKTPVISIHTLALIIVFGLIFFSCKKDENKSPNVTITNPADNTEISLGDLVEIAVSAEDPDGLINQVQLAIGGMDVASTDSFPYRFQWDTRTYGTGSYILRATALDDEGARGTHEIQVTLGVGIPSVVTAEVTDTSARSATLGGEIITNGGANIIERGIVYNTTSNPDTSAMKFTMGSGTGLFSAQVGGLSPNTMYYIKAYAINSEGVAYGEEKAFLTLARAVGTFIDQRDGQEYEWVEIGEQTWMAENLNYDTTEGTWTYNNNPDLADTYGRLYNWEMANEVCPSGWHLPSDEEWTAMVNFLGADTVAGGELKEEGTQHWYQPNEDATNSTGFTALPGGMRFWTGSFSGRETMGYFWSATMLPGSNYAYYRRLNHDNAEIDRLDDDSRQAFSVRCVRD